MSEGELQPPHPVRSLAPDGNGTNELACKLKGNLPNLTSLAAATLMGTDHFLIFQL